MSALHSFVLAQVREAFPGQYNIPVRKVAPFIGYAYKTARNMGENFPIATVKQGGLRFVPVAALVEYLVAQQLAAGIQLSYDQPAVDIPATQPTKRGPGRPPKLAASQGRAAQ